MRLLSIAILATLVLLLTGCPGTVKPDVPRGVIVMPKAVQVTRTVYRDVPPELTDPLPIAEGPLSLCPDVAAERAKTIRKANADRKSVRALSGTDAKP